MVPKKQEENLRGCLEWTFNLIKFAGYWFPRGGDGKKILMYALYSVPIVNITLIACVSTESAYVVTTFGQLQEMIDSLFLLLTHAMQCLKVLTFISKREQIYKLLDCIEEDIFQPKNLRQWESAIKIIRYTNKLAKILVSLVIGCCIFYGLAAMTEAINGTRQLPAKALFPFKTGKSPIYEIIAVYVTICLLICGCSNAAMDMTSAAFISLICIQLDVLSDTLTHIKDFAEIELAKKSYLPCDLENKDTISPELEREMKNVLVECVKHHLKVKEFSESIQSIFSFPLFAQFLTAVGTICTTLFKMSLVSKRSPYFGELLMYQGCMLTEIAIFCWYGNEVIYKSRKLATSLYNSEWVGCSQNYKKMILITISNMQNDMTICVGGFIVFSLQTLLTVLQTAWSYFLVLDQVRED